MIDQSSQLRTSRPGGTSRPSARRWLFLASLVCGVATATSACRPDADRTSAFNVYLEQLSGWAPVEAETERTIRRILATQFVDEALVRQEVGAAVPRLRTHLARISEVAPADPDLLRIHEEYRTAWLGLAAALEDIPKALDAAEPERLATARTAMTAWREDILRIANELRRLRP